MTTGLNASLLRSIEGSVLDVGGVPVRFERGVRGKPATMKGGEGYACPVTRLDTNESSILKIFLLPSEERQLRTRFLASLRLHSLPLGFAPFTAAPRSFIGGHIRAGDDEAFVVEGSLAPRLACASFRTRLLKLDWTPPVVARQRVASQLCIAIEVLERGAGLAHGDLSSDNVYIEGNGDALDVRLIDFDGFFHRDVPMVPCSDDEGGRKTGTEGYRAAAYSSLSQDDCVRSDRVALAILVVELMILQGEDVGPDGVLERESLLEQADINRGVLDVPAELLQRWPAGFDLLGRALSTPDPSAAPSPAEWRKLIAQSRPQLEMERVSRASAMQLGAFVVFVREQHQPDREVRLHYGQGDFSALHRELNWLSYTTAPQGLRLEGVVPQRDGARPHVMVRRGGINGDLERHREEHVRLDVPWSDVLLWGRFELYFATLTGSGAG